MGRPLAGTDRGAGGGRTRGRTWPSALRGVRLATAGLSGAAGMYLFSDGVGRLGRQITPFPKPTEQGDIRHGGAYGLIRHPMHGGVLLTALGWALASSPLVLVPLAAAFLEAKRRREEA